VFFILGDILNRNFLRLESPSVLILTGRDLLELWKKSYSVSNVIKKDNLVLEEGYWETINKIGKLKYFLHKT